MAARMYPTRLPAHFDLDSTLVIRGSWNESQIMGHVQWMSVKMLTGGNLSLPLSDDKLSEVSASGKDFALCQGIGMRTSDDPNSSEFLNFAPFTLFPSVIPRRCFQEAVAAQVPYNLLMHKVAHDFDFLRESLKLVIETDEFVQRLWNILKTVQEEKSGQPVTLNLNRSDYMVDVKNPAVPPQIKQIEFNTIASSFAGLTSQLTEVHRFTLDVCGSTDHDSKLPHNYGSLGLAEGMVSAWKLYNKPSAGILFLVETVSRNIFDQRWLEFKVHSINRTIRVIRKTFLEVYGNATLTSDRRLIIDDIEVALVYYRCGYIPDNYTSEKEWEARLMMERSLAIKCPSVQSHLAGSKKIQQVLAQPGILERFLDNKDDIEKLKKTFAGLYTLDLNPEGDKSVALALKNPQHFVMKPQREGGGNNLYGDEIVKKLNEINSTEEREAYILMERIFPPTQKNYLLRAGVDLHLSDVVNELGVFGILIGNEKEVFENRQCGHLLRTKIVGTDEGGVAAGNEKEVFENRQCGHLLRTKIVGTDEGGVAAGYAGIDSPYLMD